MEHLPFKGIAERPYDQDRLSDVDWLAIEPIYVALADTFLTQTHITIRGMFGRKYSTDPWPRVVRFQGEQYLEDGHHRAILRALGGGLKLSARVYTLEG